MDARMDSFVMEHLVPLLSVDISKAEAIFAIVSHGIIVNHLWKSCRKLFSRANVALAPGIEVKGGLEYLGGWSNTGYLELDIQRVATEAHLDNSGNIQPTPPSPNIDETLPSLPLRMIVKAVNNTDHLKSLKRTRGGVGSAAFDEGQKKIESFFKRPRVGWADMWTGPPIGAWLNWTLLPLYFTENYGDLHSPQRFVYGGSPYLVTSSPSSDEKPDVDWAKICVIATMHKLIKISRPQRRPVTQRLCVNSVGPKACARLEGP